MFRYARVDTGAVGPRQVLGIIECEKVLTEPDLVAVADSKEACETSWYWAQIGDWVPSRPSSAHEWTGSEWALNVDLETAQKAAALAILYQDRLSAINGACEAAITAGFPSAALGEPHTYGSALDDQLNLTGAVLSGLDVEYPCRDAQGVKAYRLHTIEQLNQVSTDFTLFKLQLLQLADQLKQQLDQARIAGDEAALQAIAWEGVQ